MLLVIDVGNTNIVLGLYVGDELKANWRISTKKSNSTDEYGTLIVNLFQVAGLPYREVTGMIVSSVVPPLTTTIQNMATKYFGIMPLQVGPGIKTGMPILYENPREVGADRIVNAIAAYQRFPESLIIVDFGTATTFDVVSEKGEYMGGVITPGITISMDALFTHTAKLPRFEIKKPRTVIGKNTIHSMQSGILYGYVSLVDGIVDRIFEELQSRPRVIATGGLAPIIVPETRTIEQICENLTLDGLRLIWEMNHK